MNQSDILKVEHGFTFGFSDKWDKPLRKAVQSWVDISFHLAESFRFIAIGFCAYLVLLGASKCIEADARGRKSSSSSDSSGKSSKSSSEE